ncbi:MAG: HTTM domain-containing protein [Acidimicrobiales bacterium]
MTTTVRPEETPLGTPRAYLAPAPPERLALLRILVGSATLAYLVVRLPHLLDVIRLGVEQPERFSAVGAAHALSGPVPTPIGVVAVLVALGSGVAATIGWRWRVTGPVFAASVLSVLSYRNSFGQIFHTENLVVVHLVVLAMAPAADAVSLDRRRRDLAGAPPPPALSPRYGWPAQLMVIAVVVAYVVAGWAKVRTQGLGWASGDVLRDHVAHDSLRKELVGDRSSPIGTLALRNDWVFTPMAVFGLAIELLAPIALLGGRLRVGWAVGAWVFHIGVLAVMGILFPYQVLGIAFACFVAVETIPQRWRRRGDILTT